MLGEVDEPKKPNYPGDPRVSPAELYIEGAIADELLRPPGPASPERVFRGPDRAVWDPEEFWATEKQGGPPMAPVDMYSREMSSGGTLGAVKPGHTGLVCFVCREPISGQIGRAHV